MKNYFAILMLVLTVALSLNCTPAISADKIVDTKITPAKISDGVYSITLPEIDPALPDKPGKQFVQNLCVTCHTTHYILNQPDFSREVWTAEITKMQKVFNAPIPAESVPTVLEYLMAVRGK